MIFRHKNSYSSHWAEFKKKAHIYIVHIFSRSILAEWEASFRKMQLTSYTSSLDWLTILSVLTVVPTWLLLGCLLVSWGSLNFLLSVCLWTICLASGAWGNRHWLWGEELLRSFSFKGRTLNINFGAVFLALFPGSHSSPCCPVRGKKGQRNLK